MSANMPWDDRIGRRLKLKDLQILLAVAEAKGMGKAAVRLKTSQPAISQAIASLEETFGKRLLERSHNGVALTPYGEALLNGGTAVFDVLHKTVADIDFLSDPTAGEVRIGCTEPASTGIVSSAVDRLYRRHTRISFQIVVREPTGLYQELLARNVDFAVSTMNHPIDEDNVQSEILYDDPIVVVANLAHRLANKRRIKFIDLVDENWILAPAHSFISLALMDAFRTHTLKPPRVAVTTQSAFLRIMMVAQGQLLTALPAGMLQIAGKSLPIKSLSVELVPTRTPMRLVTLKNRSISPVAQLCMNSIRQIARKLRM